MAKPAAGQPDKKQIDKAIKNTKDACNKLDACNKELAKLSRAVKELDKKAGR